MSPPDELIYILMSSSGLRFSRAMRLATIWVASCMPTFAVISMCSSEKHRICDQRLEVLHARRSVRLARTACQV